MGLTVKAANRVFSGPCLTTMCCQWLPSSCYFSSCCWRNLEECLALYGFIWLLEYLFRVLWCSAKTCEINLMVHYVLCLLRSEAEIKMSRLVSLKAKNKGGWTRSASCFITSATDGVCGYETTYGIPSSFKMNTFILVQTFSSDHHETLSRSKYDLTKCFMKKRRSFCCQFAEFR